MFTNRYQIKFGFSTTNNTVLLVDSQEFPSWAMSLYINIEILSIPNSEFSGKIDMSNLSFDIARVINTFLMYIYNIII